MATFDDVRRLALALPETAEGFTYGNRAWKVKGQLFAWERPLNKPDLAALGDQAPKGAILGVRVEGLDAKEMLIEVAPKIYFTIPHFNGYPAVLVRLGAITVPKLKRLLIEAWRVRAPAKLVKAHLDLLP
jgi:hypothetical protein